MKKKLILGLCNPGREYDITLHNIGQACLCALAATNNIVFTKHTFFYTAEYENLLFAYSNSTYINDSGTLMLQLQKRFTFDTSEMIVLHDEVMLAAGQIKQTVGGSAKGHNGLRDIIEKIGTNFHRIKIGVDHPGKGNDLGHYLTKKTNPHIFNQIIQAFLTQIPLNKLI